MTEAHTRSDYLLTKLTLSSLLLYLAISGAAFANEESADIFDLSDSQKECDSGEAQGCFRLGMIYRNRAFDEENKKNADENLVRKYFVMARENFERACAEKVEEACLSVGLLYQHGRGVEKDQVKAFEYFELVCKGAYRLGCLPLGEYYLGQRSEVQDKKKALYYFERGCEGEDPYACGYLSWMYQAGVGVERDFDKASDYYRRSCTGKNEGRCPMFGVLREDNEGK